jgi:hypothetical protein
MKSPKIRIDSIYTMTSLLMIILFVVQPLIIYFVPDLRSTFLKGLPDMTVRHLIVVASGYGIIAWAFLTSGIYIGRRLRIRKTTVFFGRNIVRIAYMVGYVIFFLSSFMLKDLLVNIYNNPLERDSIVEGKGYLLTLLVFAYPAVFLHFRCVLERRAGLLAFILVFIPINLIFFMQGGRLDVLTFWLVLIFIYSRKYEGLSLPNLTIISMAFIAFLAFGLIWRTYGLDYETIILSSQDPVFFFARIFVHSFIVFDNFVAYLYLTYYEHQFYCIFGETLLNLLLQPIPSSLIDKPLEPSFELMRLMYPHSVGGAPFTFVGLFHLNFHYLSVFCITLLGFAAGVMTRVLQNTRSVFLEVLEGFFIVRFLLFIWGVAYSSVLMLAQFAVVMAFCIMVSIPLNLATRIRFVREY